MAWSSHRRRRPRPSSAEAQRFRVGVLQRDGYVCQLQLPGCTHRATEADHVLAWEQGGTNALANGQAVCSSCHKIKTQQEAQAARAAWKRKPARHPGLDQRA